MAGPSERVSTSEALAGMTGLLDRMEPDRRAMAPGERLECAKAARRLAGRVTALADLLLAEADRVQASLQATGTPTSSWLGADQRLSKREASAALHRAQDLASHPEVGRAATAGEIGAGQARAIARVLDSLAPQLDAPSQEQAETLLVSLAASLDADELAKQAGRVLQEVAPSRADELLETRLQREAEAAQRNRSLRFWRDGGSLRFDGSLPRVEGEQWMCQLDAYAESQRRAAIEQRDPLAASLTPEQRRADALVGMIRAHGAARAGREGPRTGGDRPRVIVKLDFEALRREAAGAGLIADDQPLSAGELRLLCCDAGLLPAVLGGPSEVLDVGRERRLVTPAIRAALIARDGGCAFPGCHARPAQCEAHHIVPWWQGGRTELANLVLLCHHHHALVEPARYGVRDQWEVRVALDGAPEFLPPARMDPNRRPVRHGRFLSRAA